MNFFNIPLYYISFNADLDFESNFKKFGFINIHHFKAIDGKQFKPADLLQKKLITVRAYNDLIYGRHQHAGLPSLGAIGCALSHYEIWKVCLSNKWPCIIIAENDCFFRKPLTKKNIKDITSAISKPNGIFVSEKIINNHFMCSHLYFASFGACKTLVENFLPIDIQVDLYTSHLAKISLINLTGYPIVSRKKHKSAIQDICIKCKLPNNMYFYIIFILVLVLVFIVICKVVTG
jgi:GR25 family glycosyltransferase involved in LPS biosynthesis